MDNRQAGQKKKKYKLNFHMNYFAGHVLGGVGAYGQDMRGGVPAGN